MAYLKIWKDGRLTKEKQIEDAKAKLFSETPETQTSNGESMATIHFFRKCRLLASIAAVVLVVLVGTSIVYGTTDTGNVKIIGPEEIVFDWTTDRCDMLDLPDLPARAFRDADGKVQLIATHFINRRMIGDTLDSVKRDCQIIMNSHKDPDPSQFNDREWLVAVYTLDGRTIYALVHNEYQGHKAGNWHAQNDFYIPTSRQPRSKQGYKNWYYQEWNGVRYRNMRYDRRKKEWKGSREYCLIGPNNVHPQKYAAARKWVSPISGKVSISGKVYDQDRSCGDGVVVKIFKSDEELWSRKIANGDSEGYEIDLEVSVEIGEAIYFRVHQGDNSDCDSTYFNPIISVVPCQCSSGDYLKCQYNSITFAKSTDMGCTYSHSEAPNHLVASAPYRYEPDTGPWGIFGGTNIIYNPNDGYYYTMLHLEKRFLQDLGTGVMRTKTLDDPKSWRAWDGKDLSVRFINPYTEPDADPSKHICQPVSRDEISKLHASLTFNTYFDKFLLVGSLGQWDPEQKKFIHGFCYSLSDDLIHWTKAKLIMEAKFPWTPDLPGEVLLYPSLLDPADTSRNFERTGKRVYLYYTRMHPYTQQNRGLDRDLVRVPIEFYRSEKTGGKSNLEDQSKKTADKKEELSAEQYENVKKHISWIKEGSICGIGVNISKVEGGIIIEKVIGEPAKKAGLKAGDIIIAVEGKSTVGMTMQEAVEMITGTEGSVVKLTVRNPQGRMRNVKVTRAKIKVSSVDSRILDSNIGFIQIGFFSKNTAEDVQKALDKFSGKGVTGIIIDLRGNRGGLLSEVVELAEIFIPPQKTLWYFRKPGKGYEQVKTKTPQLTELPVVLLIDERTVSAAEMLALSFKRTRRGTLIGRKTFGKASAAKFVKQADGTSKRVETAKFFIKPGQPITGRGILPNIKMPANATNDDFIEKAVQVLQKKI